MTTRGSDLAAEAAFVVVLVVDNQSLHVTRSLRHNVPLLLSQVTIMAASRPHRSVLPPCESL